MSSFNRREERRFEEAEEEGRLFKEVKLKHLRQLWGS